MRVILFGRSILILCTALCGSATAQGTSSRAIYRCEADGVLTFSDRPCQTGAEPYELDAKALNTFEPPPARPASRPAVKRPKSGKKSSGAAVDPDKHKEKCDRLSQSLKDLRSKQRSGYKAGEANRLKDRETKLKSQLREARCS